MKFTLQRLFRAAPVTEVAAARSVYVPEEGLRSTPVFHQWADAHPGQWGRTACGVETTSETPRLRADHAAAFARPCKLCYPGGIVLVRIPHRTPRGT